MVGTGNHALSPAQAQQLALARLVLADPHTLVLDEATSLIDPRAARHLERSLAAVLEGRTVIAIAHRLFSAHDADRVAVVEDGRITELGSHDELVAAGGSYAALWALLARHAARRDRSASSASRDRYDQTGARSSGRRVGAGQARPGRSGESSTSRPRRPPETNIGRPPGAPTRRRRSAAGCRWPSGRDAAADVAGRALGRGRIGHRGPLAADRRRQRLQVERSADRHDADGQHAVDVGDQRLEARVRRRLRARPRPPAPYAGLRGSCVVRVHGERHLLLV